MKKAICTGINNYPGTANDLQGCVNDANDWSNLLTSLDFTVTKLLDSQVTGNAFSTAIKNAVSEMVAGDVLVITYSGHGTQVIDNSGDEEDGYDEALYLYDGVFTDDQMRSALSGIKDGVHVFFISDSCFSGTITRKINLNEAVGKPRFVVTDPIPPTAKPVTKFLLQENMKEIVLTGCSDMEYSYDAYINGKWNGAMTAYAIKSIIPGSTYNQFYSILRSLLPSNQYPQTPQLEGKAENKAKVMFEPFIDSVSLNDTTSEPTPNANGCLIPFLSKLFVTKKKLNSLSETQLVFIANELGINASISDLKSNTLDKIWNLINKK